MEWNWNVILIYIIIIYCIKHLIYVSQKSSPFKPFILKVKKADRCLSFFLRLGVTSCLVLNCHTLNMTYHSHAHNLPLLCSVLMEIY